VNNEKLSQAAAHVAAAHSDAATACGCGLVMRLVMPARVCEAILLASRGYRLEAPAAATLLLEPVFWWPFLVEQRLILYLVSIQLTRFASAAPAVFEAAELDADHQGEERRRAGYEEGPRKTFEPIRVPDLVFKAFHVSFTDWYGELVGPYLFPDAWGRCRGCCIANLQVERAGTHPLGQRTSKPAPVQ